jgi:hypothetical protein
MRRDDTAFVLRLLDHLRRHPLRRRPVRLSAEYLRAVRQTERAALVDRDKTWVFDTLRSVGNIRVKGRWR